MHSTMLKRLHVCEQIVGAFWKNWQQKYFHTFIARQRWHTEVRNLQVGDVVSVKNAHHGRGKWQLAILKVAVPGKDSHVCDVTLKYKPNKPGVDYDDDDLLIERSGHRLVLLLPIKEQ